MKVQGGFTLIELMVVIVIIGILSALAVPKMFGVSAKAKAAEAPGIIANWETLQSAYAQETGLAGANDVVGFQAPTYDGMADQSNWFSYTNSIAAMGTGAVATLTAAPTMTFGDCLVGTDSWVSEFTAATDLVDRSVTGACPASYTPNFD